MSSDGTKGVSSWKDKLDVVCAQRGKGKPSRTCVGKGKGKSALAGGGARGEGGASSSLAVDTPAGVLDLLDIVPTPPVPPGSREL